MAMGKKKRKQEESEPVLAHVQDNIRGANSSSAAQSPSEGGQCSAHNNADDEVLRRFDALRKLRKAVSQAAEIARHDAEEVLRLQTIAGIHLREHQPLHDKPTISLHPQIPIVPATYDVRQDNEPVLKARAERVLDLGSYWSSQTPADQHPNYEHPLHAAVRKVGGYQDLAKALKTRLGESNDSEK